MNSTAIATPVRNRRELARTPTTLRGKAFPGGRDCVIDNFNRRGARLVFSDVPPADAQLVLVIWSSGFAFAAEVRWRGGAEMGVQFQRRYDLRKMVPPELAEVKEEWLNRRQRLPRRKLQDCQVITGYRGPPRGVRLS
jgi:hypothetical protein